MRLFHPLLNADRVDIPSFSVSFCVKPIVSWCRVGTIVNNIASRYGIGILWSGGVLWMNRKV